MKKITTIAFLFTCTIASAQINWPTITQTAKPWARWWWEGSAVDKKDLTAAMSQYQQAGLGGLEITPIYGVKGHENEFIDFLSINWMEMLKHTLNEGKRLGLGIDLANATGWPFGGPWVTPADACKDINLKTYSLKEGENLQENVVFQQETLMRSDSHAKVDISTLSYPIATNKNLQSYAFDQVRYPKVLPITSLMAYSDKGQTIDLTNKVDNAGKLNWTALQGNWTLYALFQGWHGKMVERAAPGGEGDVIDHFSAPALQHYLARFDEAFKGRDISGLRSFFNDSYEVDDARGQSNWTPGFFNEFQKRRGYDLRNVLPALFQKDTDEKNSRVLYDYRLTVSDLIVDNFTTPWQKWAKEKGKMVRNQSHGSPANLLDCYAVVDIPETEGGDVLQFKFATSAAHIMGKQFTSSESATWLNEHFQSSWGDVKTAMDKFFVGGVNHVFYHGVAYSPQQEPWPGYLFYAAVHFQPVNPMWKDFNALNTYAARVQSFLQQGIADNDVLMYFPFHDRISDPGKEMLHHFDGMNGFDKTDFKTSSTFMLENGYSFDFISDKQLLNVKNIDQQITIGGGNYHTIVIPNCKYIPLQTMEKLKQLATDGATIVFYKNLPKDIPGFGGLVNKQNALNTINSQLIFDQTLIPTIKEAKIGKGSFLIGHELADILNFAKARKENMLSMGLQFNRRRTANGFSYFISNTGKSKIDGWVNINCKMNSAALYEPMFGKKGIAKTKAGINETTDVYVQLNPNESCIVKTSATKLIGDDYPYVKIAGKAETIEGDWAINFIAGGPILPEATTAKKLGSWTDLNEDGVKEFSGSASYKINMGKPKLNAMLYLLDLGKVAETAEVLLNGQKIGTAIGPLYQLQIPATAFKLDNVLEIIVSNDMANRIADMDKKGVVWKKFYNTNFPARKAENKDANGLFTAAKWEPKASGLLGPVTLIPINPL